MFAIRFLVLAFLIAWGFGMLGVSPRNAFGELIALSLVLTVPALYMLPTFEAWKRSHPKIGAISILNIFLGWSLIGWVSALVWAYSGGSKSGEIPRQVKVETTFGDIDSDTWRDTSKPLPVATKKCPYCAEEIKPEAIKCKHCQSDLTEKA